MASGRKSQARLAKRIQLWESISGDVTGQDKRVRRHDGHCYVSYRKPGSQNRKKG